ncbi:hypothetical protein OY671_012573, partial [Metschnikowia pulcherrima]
RKLGMSGGEAVWDSLGELSAIVKKVEASNDPAFGTTGEKSRDAVASVERTSKWSSEKIASSPAEALAGATPYSRMFSTTLGGCMSANEASAARTDEALHNDAQRYVASARFFAENVTVQSGASERTIMDAATATTGADVVSVT